jgi:hypothetical protein
MSADLQLVTANKRQVRALEALPDTRQYRSTAISRAHADGDRRPARPADWHGENADAAGAAASVKRWQVNGHDP